MEAGNRCFDQRVPEETNRKLVDHLADINLTYSDISREYLLREGLPPDQIIKTGSPMFEILSHFEEAIEKSKVLKELKLTENQYFLVSSHREENINNNINFLNLIESLNALAEKYKLPVIVSTHPRTKKQIEASTLKSHSLVNWLSPQGYFDYNKLQKNALTVLSDSGTISEESSILNFKALNLREAHERPEAMEEAAVMMVGLKKERILQGIALVTQQNIKSRDFPIVDDYSKPNVSAKVERIILSYIDYVNSKVWRKES
jgi:UDP-N-acetylglucosamine 2-epimerase (non-hydrolysing)